MKNYLEFEDQIAGFEGRIAELQSLSTQEDAEKLGEEIARLESKTEKAVGDLYKKLDPWQKALVARHPERPHCLDYIDRLITDFTPMAGDRKFAEDHALIGGMGRFDGDAVMIIGQEKGHDTQSRLARNFGMARPEGYRKAVRLMELAERFSLPVISFIDTAGAYPGIGAEERGQAEAIARSTDCCLGLGVPLVSVIIGEGGSGGAVAIATANSIVMLEHAVYSVISPEGAASILWRDSGKAKDAATAMKITSQDLSKLGIIDDVVAEPVGGAHRDPDSIMAATGQAIAKALLPLKHLSPDELRRHRHDKFLSIGGDL